MSALFALISDFLLDKRALMWYFEIETGKLPVLNEPAVSGELMNRKKLFFTLVALIIISPSVLSSEVVPQTTIVLNTADVPPYSTPAHTGISDRVLKEAFRRIGIPMRIVYLPSERALFNANEGIDDGNFARIKEINFFLPNLVVVPESLLKFEFVVFSKYRSFKPDGWESLQPYNIGIVRGWKILEANITGAKSLTKVKNEKLLFSLLASDKADMVVYDRMQGLCLLNNSGYQDIHVLKPPLVVRDMYLHLHNKYSHLVEPLAKTIREIKKDGTYNRIVRQVLNTYLRESADYHDK